MYADQFGFNFDYDLRVRSTTSVAYYSQAIKMKGDDRSTYTQKAINFALDANGNDRFPYGNSLMTLSIKIANNNDLAAAELMLVALDGITPTDEEEKGDLMYFKNKLRGVTVGQ